MEILDGPGSSWGYRSVQHALQRQGIRVPRKVVNCAWAWSWWSGDKSHKLHRRKYICPMPNEVWHADGYDKLKPFGFPIHGCIDGYSRKVLWLYVTRSKNLPDSFVAWQLQHTTTFHKSLGTRVLYKIAIPVWLFRRPPSFQTAMGIKKKSVLAVILKPMKLIIMK